MNGRRVKMFLLLVAGSAVLWPNGTAAQEPQKTPKQEQIQELFRLTGGEKLFQNIMDAAIQGSQKHMADLVRKEIEKKGVEGRQREEELKKAETFLAQYLKNIRELLPLRIHMDSFFQGMAVLYDKYFSEDDLKVMLDYHRSPTGQKALRLMPQIMQEIMQSSRQSLGAEMDALVREALETTKAQLKEVPTGIY